MTGSEWDRTYVAIVDFVGGDYSCTRRKASRLNESTTAFGYIYLASRYPNDGGGISRIGDLTSGDIARGIRIDSPGRPAIRRSSKL